MNNYIAVNQPEKTPTVSVIMNCLNCSGYLREAIESVYAQTFTDWEIIFWDNASTDRSAGMAKGFDGRLRYFRSEQTVPLGKARNRAMEKARGRYLAFLDCDDVWMPEKLEKQMALFEKNPRVGLVYCNTVFFNQSTGKERTLYKSKRQPQGMVFRELLTHYFLSMETVVIRRDCLDRLDEWFDERFEVVEEADLFIRIAHDWEVDYVHEPLAKWRMHAESWTWKRTGLFADELKMMLDKFAKLYKGFERDYKNEIKKIEAKAAYRRAVEEWKKDNRSGARKKILPYIKNDPRLLIIYALSSLSYENYARLFRLLGRHA